MLHTFLMAIHILSAVCVVALVLVQRGKGADAGAGFGAGASGTVFGARGASTALSRGTAILAGVFMVTSLTLAYMGTHRTVKPSDSLLDQLAQKEATDVPVVPAAPAQLEVPAPTAAPAPAPVVPPAK